MSKVKALFKFILVFGLVFGISFGLGTSIHKLLLTDNEPRTTDTPVAKGERTNILLLGVDERPGEKQGRSDTMILASIDPKLNKVALVSIPRDTQINVTGSSLDKINSANMVGGPTLAAKKVEELTGEKVDYYVEMNFKGFAKIIDAVGGVNINVDQRMYKPSEDIDLKPGQQLLDGSQALAFVRFRGYALGDIERTEHQQIFLKALGQELLQPKNIIKLPSLIKVADQNIDTNLSMADMLKMVAWVPGFGSDSIVAQTLPGYFLDKRDAYGNLTASYWIADKTKTEGLLEKMLSGQTVAVVSEAPASYNTGNTNKANTASSNNESATATDEINWERSRLPSAGHETQNKV